MRDHFVGKNFIQCYFYQNEILILRKSQNLAKIPKMAVVIESLKTEVKNKRIASGL